MKTIRKVVNFMDDHLITIYGTWATAALLWLLENRLKGND